MLRFLFGGPGQEQEGDENDDTSTQNNDSQIMDEDETIPQNESIMIETAEVIPMEEESNLAPPPEPVTPSAQATLVDLLVKAFPDSMIEAPKIVIVGSQSSGKTKLIISMIFSSLIQHPHFTDDMGDILLRVFRTGVGLTTRRPIKVNLLHSSDQNNCSINFRYGSESFDFGDPNLLNFIDGLHDFSGNEIFESPLEITIRAYQLPNIQFTDMPGLRSKDVSLEDSPSKTLKGLVTEWIENGANTVIAVESAMQFSSGGADTSLLYPLIEEVASRDPGLHLRSILVLTKCDRIVADAFNVDILPLFTHFNQSPISDLFQCVIAVVNKIDGQPEPHTISFADFRAIFDRTKQEERRIFRHRGNLSNMTQCTTHALFIKINDIFKTLLTQALSSGYENMQRMEAEVSQQIRQQLAPPIYLYQDEQGLSPASTTNSRHFSKKHLLEEIRKAVLDCAKRSVVSVPLIDESSIVNDFSGNESSYLLVEIGLSWPASFELGNIEDGLKRRQFFDMVIARLEIFLDLILARIDQIFTDVIDGVFAERHSPFHHLHRFSNLQGVLQQKLVGLCDQHRHFFIEKLHQFMQTVWIYEEPSGKLTLSRLVQVLRQARHLLVIECIVFLNHYLNEELNIDWTIPGILEEAVSYVDNRHRLYLHYERVLLQCRSLEQCLEVQATQQNEAEQLEMVIETTRAQLEALASPTLYWEAEFWYNWYLEYREQQQYMSTSVPSTQQHQSTSAARQHSSSNTNPSYFANQPNFLTSSVVSSMISTAVHAVSAATAATASTPAAAAVAAEPQLAPHSMNNNMHMDTDADSEGTKQSTPDTRDGHNDDAARLSSQGYASHHHTTHGGDEDDADSFRDSKPFSNKRRLQLEEDDSGSDTDDQWQQNKKKARPESTLSSSGAVAFNSGSSSVTAPATTTGGFMGMISTMFSSPPKHPLRATVSSSSAALVAPVSTDRRRPVSSSSSEDEVDDRFPVRHLSASRTNDISHQSRNLANDIPPQGSAVSATVKQELFQSPTAGGTSGSLFNQLSQRYGSGSGNTLQQNSSRPTPNSSSRDNPIDLVDDDNDYED